jgi:hypothetical protein
MTYLRPIIQCRYNTSNSQARRINKYRNLVSIEIVLIGKQDLMDQVLENESVTKKFLIEKLK